MIESRFGTVLSVRKKSEADESPDGVFRGGDRGMMGLVFRAYPGLVTGSFR